MTYNNLRPAVFLDRDGVINYNRNNYIREWSQLHIIPGSLAALAKLAASSYVVVIVTNQSGVGRGLFSQATAMDINNQLLATIREHGGRIDRVELCPHTPADNCDCRKPRPGMLHSAAAVLGLDLKRSWLVGDALTDMQAGQAAGVRPLFVLSGRDTLDNIAGDRTLTGTPHFPDLAAAIGHILSAM